MKTIISFALASLLLSGCVAKSQYDETLASYHGLTEQLSKVTKEKEQCRTRTADLEKRVVELEDRNEEITNTNQLLLSKNRNFAEKTITSQKEILKIKQETQAKTDKTSAVSRFYEDFLRSFSQEISESTAKVQKDDGKTTLILSDDILFLPGTINITKQGFNVIKQAAGILKRVKEGSILVGAHTDDSPLTAKQKKTFGSTWELSALRATKVVKALESQGVDTKKLAATGYAGGRPISSNEIHEGRLQNRRVEISVVQE